MPRKSSSSSIYEKKISSVPIKQELPVVHSQRPSFFQTMKEGIALGVGSSIGHRIVGAFMGSSPPPSPSPSHMPSVQYTNTKKEEYEQCLKEHDDRAACQRFLEN